MVRMVLVGMFPRGSWGPLAVDDWAGFWSLSDSVDSSQAQGSVRALGVRVGARLCGEALPVGGFRWLRQGTDAEPRFLYTRTCRLESGALVVEDRAVVRGVSSCMVLAAALSLHDGAFDGSSGALWLRACDAALACDNAREAELDALDAASVMGSDSFASFERAAHLRRVAQRHREDAEVAFASALDAAVNFNSRLETRLVPYLDSPALSPL